MFFDGHNDTLTKHYPPRHLRTGSGAKIRSHSFITGNSKCHMDLPGIKEAGFQGGIFAVFVDPLPEDGEEDQIGSSYLQGHKRQTGPGFPLFEPPIDSSLALTASLEVLSHAYQDERAADGQIKIVRTKGDLQTAIDSGSLAMVLHLEGCEAVDSELRLLEVFWQAGIRSLGLCWSRPNIFGTGVPFAYGMSPDLGPGLSEAGKRLVRRCHELGILVDLAHLNAAGFYDALALSSKPIAVSHTAAHALCPSARNLTDRQLDCLAENGGLAGVTFHVPDLLGPGGECASTVMPGAVLTPLQAIAAHIKYIGERIGYEHVALGSDFDGCTVPEEIANVRGLKKLPGELEKLNISPENIEKVCSGNWQRILKEILPD
ncbi:membrane dipeptidase [bacterium]|nr:membrane dipeptidase [bacterium]